MWDTSSLDDDTLLEELHSLGQQYINGVLTLCGNNALASIWGEQDTAFQQDGSSHEVKIWVAPAVTDDSQAEARQGDCYNTVADQQMADFVTTVQASAASCCVSGIDVQVSCCQCITKALSVSQVLSAYHKCCQHVTSAVGISQVQSAYHKCSLDSSVLVSVPGLLRCWLLQHSCLDHQRQLQE
jgi:hypothetical protein